MKRILFLAVILIGHLSCQAQGWAIDKAHSHLGFSVTHMMISEVEGSFKTFDIKISSSKEDFSDATVELSADINSVDTESAKRDEHLQSPDFFDAAKFPRLSFKSTSFRKTDANKYKVTGDLTLHGITKPVELEVILRGPAVNPYSKKSIAGFKATGTIKRSDFGISPNSPSAALSDEIAITANTEFIKD